MDAVLTSLLGAGKLAGKLVLIIVPLVTLFEVVRHLPAFRRAGTAVDPLMRGMGLTREAAVPLFTGVFLGIAYGAGIIIHVSRQKRLPPRDIFLMGLFLATCHAVVEDILIFAVIGGNAAVMLGARVLLAVGLTSVMGRVMKPNTEGGTG